jgi:DNA-binding response OmpR family regulator
VLDAKGAATARRIASAHAGTVHLLITDVVLPGMNGHDLYDRLASERAGLKVLFMSGYPGDILSKQGLTPEGVNLIQKPFTLQAFTVKVREILNRDNPR